MAGAARAHLRTCIFWLTEHREHTHSTTRRHGSDAQNRRTGAGGGRASWAVGGFEF
jgi:hypothetical protein